MSERKRGKLKTPSGTPIRVTAQQWCVSKPRYPAVNPRPGDILGHFLKSNRPFRREVVEVVLYVPLDGAVKTEPDSDAYFAKHRARVTYWNEHGKMRSCSLAAWREWAANATVVAGLGKAGKSS